MAQEFIGVEPVEEIGRNIEGEVQETITPKRTRGRSRKTTATQRTPPRPKSPPLEIQIGAAITGINFVVMLVPPIREDALDPVEITALARAIDAQCQASPIFKKYVGYALAGANSTQLLGVVGMIAARRMARHGMLPTEYDAMIGSMFAAEVQNITPFNTENAEAAEAA